MAEDAKKAPPPPVVEPKSSGGGGGMVALLLTAVLAGGAAFGGAKVGAAVHAAPHPVETAHKVPGPTIGLEPFLVTIPDPQRPHVVKLTIAVELKVGAKDEEFKAFVPRVRDTTLSYLRGMSFEEAQQGGRLDQLRADLLERIEKLGVTSAEQVLVTDFVTQ